MRTELLVAVILLICSGSALAQTACPQGVAAGGAQCGPSSLVNPSDSSNEDRNKQPLPEVKWADSWGAIAADDDGQYGIVTDFPSKRLAKKAAVKECMNRGGDRCKVQTTYKNQCAVVVMGSTQANVVNAVNTKEATEIGMKSCLGRGDENCRVFWSGCSHAWRVW